MRGITSQRTDNIFTLKALRCENIKYKIFYNIQAALISSEKINIERHIESQLNIACSRNDVCSFNYYYRQNADTHKQTKKVDSLIRQESYSIVNNMMFFHPSLDLQS